MLNINELKLAKDLIRFPSITPKDAGAINFLSNDGLYIIEDVYYKDKIKFINYFKNTNYNFSIVDIYHNENIANNCIVLINKNHD